MKKIPVYSSQHGAWDKPLRYETRSAALALLESGEARYIKGDAVMLVELERLNATDPSGLPASTMRALASGSDWASDKVEAWGQLQDANFRALIAQ